VSDSFRRATGRKVVSRASAQELGVVTHLVVDAQQRRIAAVVVGRGKNALLFEWPQITAWGPDAIMVSEEGALRAPVDDRERAAADGKLDLVGKRALTEGGNELGPLDDITFDPQTGAVEMLLVGTREIPAGSLLGSGSYAVVLDASQEPVS
jgi:sporulation protein YlmC with PRC-barrel domain